MMINIPKIHILKGILLICFSIFVSACSPIMIQSDPAAYPIDPKEVPEYKSKPGVAVTNSYEKPKVITMFSGGRGLEADLQQYTKTTVDILSRELGNQSITVNASGDKTVALRVYDVVYEPGMWVLHTTLKLEADLGNGQKVETVGDNRSPGNAWRSVNGALKRAVVELMKNPTFVDYIDN